MKAVVDDVVYDTEKAELIAHNMVWDGQTWWRNGRNSYLYRTRKGQYFLHLVTMWDGERDHIELIDRDTAEYWYNILPAKIAPFAEIVAGSGGL